MMMVKLAVFVSKISVNGLTYRFCHKDIWYYFLWGSSLICQSYRLMLQGISCWKCIMQSCTLVSRMSCNYKRSRSWPSYFWGAISP